MAALSPATPPPPLTFQDLAHQVEFPALILSSHAGGGNHTVGQAIHVCLGRHGTSRHRSIEELLPPRLVDRHFHRYRALCFRAPWLLRAIDRFPLNYAFDYWVEAWAKSADLTALVHEIKGSRCGTVICTNHRACFWISAIKHRGLARAPLWAVLTDYHMNVGWRYLFQPEIQRVLGPIDVHAILPQYRPVYSRIQLPLDQELGPEERSLASASRVLICGGAWGLGAIHQAVAALSGAMPELELYVICGDNRGLFRGLFQQHGRAARIHLYPTVDSLRPFLGLCGSVITKPGGATITEAHRAGRKLFLLGGLPVTEEANARYAQRHFGASRFSPDAFRAWYAAQTAPALVRAVKTGGSSLPWVAPGSS
jgi:hypothetical protein